MPSEKNKKPPMDISKKEIGGEDPKPGSLSYMSTGELEEGKSKGKFSIRKLDIKQILISSIIAIVLTGFMLFQLAPSKQAVDSTSVELRASISQTQENLTSAVKRLDNIVNTMGVYARKSDLDSYVTKAQVDSLKVPTDTYITKGDLDTYVTKEASGKYVTWEGIPNYLSEGLLSGYALKSDLEEYIKEDALKSDLEEYVKEDALSSYVVDKDFPDIDKLSGKVDGFMNKVEQLERFVLGQPIPSPELDLTLEKGVLVSFGEKSSGIFRSGLLKERFILPTTIINNLGAGYGTAKDIKLQLVLSSKGVPLGLKACTVPQGWPFEWEVSYVDERTVVITGVSLTGSSGLNIKQGESRTIWIDFSLSVSVAPAVGVPLYVEGRVVSYK